MVIKLKPRRVLILLGLLLLLVTTICHAPIFTQDLAGIHVWRQSQTQLNIINFYRYDFNILHPRHHALNINAGNTILRYEFPLMQWMIALNHKLFGPHIVVTRVSLFLFSIITLLGVFQLLLTLFKHTWSAFWGTWAFAFGPLFYYYSINPLPDNFALLHTIWFLFFFFRYIKSKRVLDVVCSALFISLAALSKLPFVLAGVVAAFYVLANSRTANRKQLLVMVVAYGLALLPPAIWYSQVIPTWGENGVLKGITENKITWEEAYRILAYHFTYTFPKVLMNEISLLFAIVGGCFMLF